jgi:tetratricopeptide (TPR) repeat protein
MTRVLASLSISVAFCAACLPAGPAVAQSARAEVAAFDFEKLVGDYYEHLRKKRFDKVREAVAVFRKTAPNREAGANLAVLMEAPLAAARKNDADARRLLAEGELATARTPEVLGVILPAFFLVDRPDFAGLTLDRMIARAPDAARMLTPDLVYATLRETGEPTATIENRRIGLAEIGFGGNGGDYLTASAIGILMKRGEVARAIGLLRYVDAPRKVEDLLIQRRFAPLWPALKEQAGSKLSNSREANIRLALQEHLENPDDLEKLAELISAYRYAGRHADAIALRDKLPRTSAELAKADEQTGWAINNLALALHEAGRADEADRLFASLNEAVPPNHWRVNMFINRVEFLVQDGRFSDALPLIGLAEKEQKSPYAEQLLRRLRYCALMRLDRKSEAAALRAELLSRAKDAKGPTIDGLVCTGELDEAEKLALQHIEDESFQEDFVRSLQRVPLTSDDPSVWGGWASLRQRPAISAAFEKLGRDLPQELQARER